MGMKYEYNYENATEKRASQEKYGRIDIPHDAPEKHPEHLWQHNHLQSFDLFFYRDFQVKKNHFQESLNPVSYTHLTLPTKA